VEVQQNAVADAEFEQFYSKSSPFGVYELFECHPILEQHKRLVDTEICNYVIVKNRLNALQTVIF